MTCTRTGARLALWTVSGLWLTLGPAAWAETTAGPAAAATSPAAPAAKKTAAPPARAANASDDPAGASVHLGRAAELYQSGRFDEVVPELQAAYHLNPLPRILCNVAQAYRRGGHPKEAAEQYDLCLRTDPKLTPQERADFNEYRQQALAASAASEPPHPDLQSTDGATGSPPPAPRPLYKRAWFWGVLGGVVAAGAITTGILVWQLSKPDPLSLLPPNTPLLRF